MALDLITKVNNSVSDDYTSVVRIIDGKPTIHWDFDTLEKVSVDTDTGVVSQEDDFSQKSFEIRVSTNASNIGTDSFIGNMSRTGVVDSQNLFWVYDGFPLQRSETYYGQLKVIDDLDRSSSWETFSFKYNTLPDASQAKSEAKSLNVEIS